MITIQISCSHCGKEVDEEISLNHPKYFTEKFIWRKLPKGWVIQDNDDNLDIYCCKKCAE
jgi:hypothetical protein